MGPITQPCDGYYPHHSSCDYLSSSLARTSFSGNALLAKKHSATQCFTHLHSEHICWQGVTDMCVCVCAAFKAPSWSSVEDRFIYKKKKEKQLIASVPTKEDSSICRRGVRHGRNKQGELSEQQLFDSKGWWVVKQRCLYTHRTMQLLELTFQL